MSVGRTKSILPRLDNEPSIFLTAKDRLGLLVLREIKQVLSGSRGIFSDSRILSKTSAGIVAEYTVHGVRRSSQSRIS